jgi:hypothetical protein
LAGKSIGHVQYDDHTIAIITSDKCYVKLDAVVTYANVGAELSQCTLSMHDLRGIVPDDVWEEYEAEEEAEYLRKLEEGIERSKRTDVDTLKSLMGRLDPELVAELIDEFSTSKEG